MLSNASRLLRFGWHFYFWLATCVGRAGASVSEVISRQECYAPDGTQNQPKEDSLEPRSLFPRLVVPRCGHRFRRSTGQYWQDPRSQQARYREKRTVRVRL